MIAIDFLLWLVAAAVYPMSYYSYIAGEMIIGRALFQNILIGLTILVSGNITRPLKEIIRVLKRVRDGYFDQKVRVTSSDEIRYTGDVINEMTEGLKERDRMRHSLELAKEVQQHFLPQFDPWLAGLDIAGQSIYCVRTGGDYYELTIWILGITARAKLVLLSVMSPAMESLRPY
jgi:hypothetical protein